jgi:hypothetical protein
MWFGKRSYFFIVFRELMWAKMDVEWLVREKGIFIENVTHIMQY